MDADTHKIKASLLATYRERVEKFPTAHAALLARHAAELSDLNDGYLRAVEMIPKIESELLTLQRQVELERNETYQQLQRLMAEASRLAKELEL